MNAHPTADGNETDPAASTPAASTPAASTPAASTPAAGAPVSAPGKPLPHAPDALLDVPLLRGIVRTTFSHGGLLLLPALLVTAAGDLVAVALGAVGAAVGEAVSTDGVFVQFEQPSWVTTGSLVVGVIGMLAGVWAIATTVVMATRDALGHEPQLAGAARLAASRWGFLVLAIVVVAVGYLAFVVGGAYLVTVGVDVVLLLAVAAVVLLACAPGLLVVPVALGHRVGLRGACARTREVLNWSRRAQKSRFHTRFLMAGVVAVNLTVHWACEKGVVLLRSAIGPELTLVVGGVVDLAVGTLTTTVFTVGLVRVYARFVAGEFSSSDVVGAREWAVIAVDGAVAPAADDFSRPGADGAPEPGSR